MRFLSREDWVKGGRWQMLWNRSSGEQLGEVVSEVLVEFLCSRFCILVRLLCCCGRSLSTERLAMSSPLPASPRTKLTLESLLPLSCRVGSGDLRPGVQYCFRRELDLLLLSILPAGRLSKLVICGLGVNCTKVHSFPLILIPVLRLPLSKWTHKQGNYTSE